MQIGCTMFLLIKLAIALALCVILCHCLKVNNLNSLEPKVYKSNL